MLKGWRLINWFLETLNLASVTKILPVVICLSQRLSHACLSINFQTAKGLFSSYLVFSLKIEKTEGRKSGEKEQSNEFMTDVVARFMTDVVARSIADLVARSMADVVARSTTDVVARSNADLVARSMADVVARSMTDVVAMSNADLVARSMADVVARSMTNVVARFSCQMVFALCYLLKCSLGWLWPSRGAGRQ